VQRARRSARNLVIWLVLTAGLVATVLGQPIIGVVLLAFGFWQLILAVRSNAGLFVDQRAADRPGRPTVS
jgi:hypothetical protein